MTLSAVLDTNVLVSGILWRGIPFQLLKWSEKNNLIIYTGLDIMAEVYRVLHHPKFQQYIENQHASPEELFTKIASLCTIIQIIEIVKGVCSDTDDEKFLSCALSANVEVLVSGDKHLLELKQYQSIRILTARDFYQENIHKLTSVIQN